MYNDLILVRSLNLKLIEVERDGFGPWSWGMVFMRCEGMEGYPKAC